MTFLKSCPTPTDTYTMNTMSNQEFIATVAATLKASAHGAPTTLASAVATLINWSRA